MKVMVIVEATQEPEAQARTVALDDRRQVAPERVFNYDVRPHSHHWQLRADVRASEGEIATGAWPPCRC
jgi:hypothetical protein